MSTERPWVVRLNRTGRGPVIGSVNARTMDEARERAAFVMPYNGYAMSASTGNFTVHASQEG